MDIFCDTDDPVASLKPGKMRTIHLHRRPSMPYFGFGIRGGREYGLGFFVTKVVPGSESELQGLSVGDQVVRIDGMRVEEALHKEMLNFIRSKTHVTLSVRSGGLVPFYECTNHALSWQPVKSDRDHHPVLSASSSWSTSEMAPSFASLTLRSDNKGRFGCSVCEGPPHRRGVYIQSTEEGSVARVAGIKAGDRILHCNGMDMTSVDFDEAVAMLKDSTVLNLIISRGAGSDFISPGESSGYNSAASSINGDSSPMQNGKQKRLSVVREEMIDVIDERRGMVVGTATVDFRRQNDNEWTRHDRNSQLDTVHKDWNRSSIVLEEQEERKRLQEERRRIQEAHKLLAEEKEKLARDRQQLEDARLQLLNGTVTSRHAIQPTKTTTSTTASVTSSTKLIPPFVEPETPVKSAAGTVHEQLMEEFKQKMVSLKSIEAAVSPTRQQQAGAPLIKAKVIPATTNTSHHQTLKTSLSAPPAPPPPPPLPTGLTVSRRKPAPPPPVPVPDYDLSPGREMEAEQDATNGIVLRRTPEKPLQPSTASGVRVSIGTYQEVRPEPTKLDFLPPKRQSSSPVGAKSSDGAIKNQLQTELNQTLSRARLRQRLPSSDLPHDDEKIKTPPSETAPPTKTKTIIQTKNNGSEVNVVRPVVFPKEMTIGRPAAVVAANQHPPPPVLSTFGRVPSAEIQAKMASLAAASTAPGGTGREATISQSADNKVTIKVQPYVPRSDFGQTTYIDSVPVTEL